MPTPCVKLSDGNSIPAVGFGTGTAWYAKTGPDGVSRELVEGLKLAISCGFRHIDSAEVYLNEISTGAALKECGVPRSEIFLTTKVMGGIKDIRGTFMKQLKDLQTTYIDLYLIHSPLFAEEAGNPTLAEAWAEMEKLKEDGLAKSIGVSNYRTHEMKATLAAVKRYKPVINQIEFNPFVAASPNAQELLKVMKANGVKIASYGPTTALVAFKDGPLKPILEDLSKTNGMTPSQMLLLYAYKPPLMDGEPQVVITTSSKDWRMKEALAAFEGPASLDYQTMKTIIAGGEKGKGSRRFMKHMDDVVPLAKL